MRHLLESQSGLVAILVSKVVIHAEVGLPAELITRLTVGDTLNYTTLEETHSAVYTHVLCARRGIFTFILKIFY